VVDLLEHYGATIKLISVPLVKYVLPYHYSLIPSEAASNLARYDGIRYGNQGSFDVPKGDKSALFSYIENQKTNSFGPNVKRRIMMGNFLMSSGAGF
jgi:aspartyl-tRNA(Asn)/glutamyl-tRNA(Gln) amidotransferase subunit A